MNNKYLSDFQIIGSTVKNLNIKNDFVSLENNKKLKKRIDISHLVGNIERLENGEILTGKVLLNIKINLSDNKKKYTLDMDIEGCFNAPSEVGEEVFGNMLEVNGVTSLYSIARGFVQSTTSQTLLNGNVLLPMINVLAYSKEIKEADGES
ncbi:MAG: hypothetical protein J6A50_04860 [Clostridia bacterium]|nr:hypothetical protein [Clostridia bacterium]